MSVIHAPNKPQVTFRVWLLPLAFLGSIGITFGRLWYYQVVTAKELIDKADTTRTRETLKLAPRGLIYDRNGKLLAGIRSKYIALATPSEVKNDPSGLIKFAGWLGTSVENLEAKMKAGEATPFLPTPIAVGFDIKIATKAVEEQDSLPGITVEQQPMRIYTDPTAYSHILGYVWKPSPNDVQRLDEQGIAAPPFVGKDGLERYYDDKLLGNEGSETMDVDAKGHPIRISGRDPSEAGKKLILSLDSDLQRQALSLLGGKIGAVVAIDPNNGEVLCLASSPSYDTGLFLDGIKKEDWEKLKSEDNGMPLFNRATRGAYPPGSTFKILTSIAAARTGQFDITRSEYCPGYTELGKHRTKCMGVHGAISYHNAFVKSCNTYFGKLGLRIGGDALRQTATELGFYSRTGIDLPAESRGVVPTDEFIKRRNKRRTFHYGDTVNMSIGQGELNVTPIQMANLVCLVANSGVNYKPHLAKAFVDPLTGATEAVQPVVDHKIDLPASFWEQLHSAMIGVVDSGTATLAKIPGIVFGGKTGTAEFYTRKKKDRPRELKTHSWFVGVAPMDHPKIAIACVVEEAGHGGTVAAPLSGQLVRTYLEKLSASAATRSNSAASASAVVPSPDRPASR